MQLNGQALTLPDIAAVALGDATVEVSPSARPRLLASRKVIEDIIARGAVVYGVTTGFGKLSDVRVPHGELRELQLNLVRSHACGIGPPLSEAEVRAMMLLRANVLALGLSGIRPGIIEMLCEMLNRRLYPVVPERGSVGASGDLAPLAHLALTLIGEGEAFFQGVRLPAKEALLRAGLKPVTLEAKEGLALVNGTQAMTAVGVLALLRSEALADLADLAGAMTLGGLLASHKPFSSEIQRVRPHPGQIACARQLREFLADSELVESHPNCAKVQDPYSRRCIPQVHGAARDGISFARSVLEIEVNSATDNPLVFTDSDTIVSGGNFHGQPVSLALDVLAMALTQLSTISERR